MLKYSIERNLRFRVVRYRQVIFDYSFSFAKRRCIPLLIASPLVIPYFSQYSFSLFSVSASRRMLNLLDLGFSAFGLPAGDIKPLPFLSHLYYIYVTPKSQYLFLKFSKRKSTAFLRCSFSIAFYSFSFLILSLFRNFHVNSFHTRDCYRLPQNTCIFILPC